MILLNSQLQGKVAAPFRIRRIKAADNSNRFNTRRRTNISAVNGPQRDARTAHGGPPDRARERHREGVRRPPRQGAPHRALRRAEAEERHRATLERARSVALRFTDADRAPNRTLRRPNRAGID